VFCEKNYNAFLIWFNFIVIIILNQLNIKKNKFDKDNFGKNHKNITWENTAIIHSVLKKKNYKVKFLISSILKKIDRHNLKKNNKTNIKKGKKNHVGNTVAIHSILWWKLKCFPTWFSLICNDL
jgi:hypothetical protein